MHTAEERERHVAAQQSSGLNVGEYCRRVGLVPSTFAGWKKPKVGTDKLVRIDNLGKEVVIELRSGAQIRIGAGEVGGRIPDI